jgi:hypothetical protein
MAAADFLGEFLAEGILRGILRGIAALIGWVYLWLRYRSAFRVRYVLVREYNRSYAEAGMALLAFVLQILVAFAGIVMLGGLFYALYIAFIA